MESAEQPLCPYCKAPYVPGATSCGSCKAAFPWAHEIAQVRGELKERETNRMRATVTLTNELYRAMRGEGSVSLQAVKGFVTAWLFPRIVIAIGSLAGIGLLAMQTYIMSQQNQLLARQADAAQVDRAAKIRERLTATGGYAVRLRRLSSAADLLPLKLSTLHCDTSACAQTPILQLTLTSPFSDPPGQTDPGAVGVFHSLVQQMEILRTTTELDDSQGVIAALIDPASIQCAMSAEQTRSAEDSVFALNLAVVSLAQFADDTRRRSETASGELAQAVQAMRRAMTTKQSIIVADAGQLLVYEVDAPTPYAYTLRTYIEELRQLVERAQNDIHALTMRCTEIIDADTRTLMELYPSRQ